MKTCPHCGRENLDRAKFCGYCGRNLTVEAEVTRRAYREGEPRANLIGQSAQAQQPPLIKPARASLLPHLILLIGLLFFGSVLVLGLRIYRSNGETDKNPMTFLDPFAAHTATEVTTLTPTLTPLPSITPTPTLTPPPTNTPLPVRLGIRRSEIQDLFINLGFTFHDTSPLGGQPRIIGRSIDKSVSIELTGIEDKLIKIALIAGDSNIGDQDLVIKVYMTRLLRRVIPQWTDATNWLDIGLNQIAESNESEPTVATTSENLRISLKLVKDMKLIFLSIEGEPAVEAPASASISPTS